jgi:hypothetical protein
LSTKSFLSAVCASPDTECPSVSVITVLWSTKWLEQDRDLNLITPLYWRNASRSPIGKGSSVARTHIDLREESQWHAALFRSARIEQVHPVPLVTTGIESTIHHFHICIVFHLGNPVLCSNPVGTFVKIIVNIMLFVYEFIIKT